MWCTRRIRTRTAFAVRRGVALVGATSLVLAAGCAGGVGGSGGADGFPEGGDLTLIAAGDPGGGLDIQSRMVEETFQEEDLSPVTMNVENIGGGGGNPARSTLLKRPNDGRTLVAESNRVFLNRLMGTTDMGVSDFTPVAKLTTEYLVWAVPSGSKWQSARQILDAVQKDPKAVSFGVGTVPSDDQFNVLRPAEEAGVGNPNALNVVVFEEGGDLTTNLVGGNVDVASTGFSEVVEQVEDGNARVLAVSAPEDADVPAPLEDVPTWQELGIDYTVDHWRGVFGPADMPQQARQWWVDTLREASKSQTWQDLAQKHRLTPDFEEPEEFRETIEQQRSEAKRIIEDSRQGS